MHYGCYKLCPKVREQQRKALEAERLRNNESPASARVEDIAGPSRQQINPPGPKVQDDGSKYSVGTSSLKTQVPQKFNENASTWDKRRKEPSRKSEESFERVVVGAPQKKRSKRDDEEINETEYLSIEVIRDVDSRTPIQKVISPLIERRGKDVTKEEEGRTSPKRTKIRTPEDSRESLQNRDRGRRKKDSSGENERTSADKRDKEKNAKEMSRPAKDDRSKREKEYTSGLDRKKFANDAGVDPSNSSKIKDPSFIERNQDHPKYPSSTTKPEAVSNEAPKKGYENLEGRDKGGKEPQVERTDKRRGSARQPQKEYLGTGKHDEKNSERQPEGGSYKTPAKDKHPEHRSKPSKEKAGPSRLPHGRESKESMKGTKDNDNDDDRSIDFYNNCDRHCRGIDKRLRKRKNIEQRKSFDEYIFNKGLCYFQDLCNCHYGCLVNQLSKDPFVKSTIVSAIVFSIGLKLCSEMDGWKITF